MLSLSTRLDHILYLSFLISTTCAQGKIAQYLDFSCQNPSSIEPTFSLPLNTCLVTSGAQGVVVQLLPTCLTANVSATLQLYKDPSCVLSVSEANLYDDQSCLATTISFGSVMFICGTVGGGHSNATRTTTVTAISVLVPVAKATEVTTTSTSGDLSSQTATGLNELVTSATAASSASNPPQTNGAIPDENSSSGLSQRDEIILGIGIPVGSLIVALLAWLWPKPWNRRESEGQQNDYQMLHYTVVHHMPHWHRG